MKKTVLFISYFYFIIGLPFFLGAGSTAEANECGSTLSNFTSPLCTDARYAFLVGSGITFAAYKGHHTRAEKIRFDIAAKRPLGKFSKVGEILGWGGVNGVYIFYQLTKGYLKDDAYSLENAEMAAEATFYTSLVTVLFKTFFTATRPDKSETDSFPSGHSSSSFAWATVVMARHEWYYGLLSYATAGAIALARINDEKHHFHDVFGGMTLGISYAWGVFLNHTHYKKDYWLTVLPTDDLRGLSFHATYHF